MDPLIEKFTAFIAGLAPAEKAAVMPLMVQFVQGQQGVGSMPPSSAGPPMPLPPPTAEDGAPPQPAAAPAAAPPMPGLQPGGLTDRPPMPPTQIGNKAY